MNLELKGAPIEITFQNELRAWRGHLSSGGAQGTPVHAGSFLRQRRIVLDAALQDNEAEFNRVVAHEILHFVWWKLGNSLRIQFEKLLDAEHAAAAPGEMGWSADWRKSKLHVTDRLCRSRRWREYCCESFCDTVSVLWSGIRKRSEITLPLPWKRKRRAWLLRQLGGRTLAV